MSDSQRIPWLLVLLVLGAPPALAGEPMPVHPQPAGGNVSIPVTDRADRNAFQCKAGASQGARQALGAHPRLGIATGVKAPGKAPAAAAASPPADTGGLSNVW